MANAPDGAQGNSRKLLRRLAHVLVVFDSQVAEVAFVGNTYTLDHEFFDELLAEAWKRGKNRTVRLLGVGVRFEDPRERTQLEFFD